MKYPSQEKILIAPITMKGDGKMEDIIMPSRYELSNAVIVANEESKQKIEEASKKGDLYEVIAEEIYAWIDKGAPPEIKNNIKNGIFGGLDVVEMKYEREQQVKKQLKKGDLRDITDQEIETWLNGGGNPNRKNKKGISILCQCIGRNNENLVKKCLENGGNPNERFKQYKSIDLVSELCAYPSLVQSIFFIWELISMFASIVSVVAVGFGLDLLTGKLNQYNEGPFSMVMVLPGMFTAICSTFYNSVGWEFCWQTPLEIASRNGNENIVRMLLEKGANPLGYNGHDYSALNVAQNDACHNLIQHAIDTWEQKSICEEVLHNIAHNLSGAAKTTAHASKEILLFPVKLPYYAVRGLVKGVCWSVKTAAYIAKEVLLFPIKVPYYIVKSLVKGLCWTAKTTARIVGKVLTFPFKMAYRGARKITKKIERAHQNRLLRKARERIKTFNFEKGSFEDFKALIEHGASVNSLDKNGSPILVSAAEKGRTDIVQYLLEHDAWINARNRNNEHALMVAIFRGHIDVIKLLIKRKDVDLFIHNKHGWSIFDAVYDRDCNTKAFLKTLFSPEEIAKIKVDYSIVADTAMLEYEVLMDNAIFEHMSKQRKLRLQAQAIEAKMHQMERE